MDINIIIFTFIILIISSIFIYLYKYKHIHEDFKNINSKSEKKVYNCNNRFQQKINTNIKHLTNLQNDIDTLNLNIDKSEKKVNSTYKKFQTTQKNAGHSINTLNNIN